MIHRQMTVLYGHTKNGYSVTVTTKTKGTT